MYSLTESSDHACSILHAEVVTYFGLIPVRMSYTELLGLLIMMMHKSLSFSTTHEVEITYVSCMHHVKLAGIKLAL